MKIAGCILMIVLLPVVLLFAGPEIETVHIEGVRYRLYGSAADRTALQEFHALFTKQSNEVYALHGERPPLTTDVAIAGNADIFRQLSGAPWFVAGLYDPATDRLIFQRPAALQQRGLLVSTIRHEVCHRLLAGLRSPGVEAPHWLEEGYCESLGRTAAPDCTGSAAWMRDTIDLTSFQKKLSAGLRSGRHAERRQAFCVAAEFAHFLVQRRGRSITLQTLLGRSPVQPESYTEFRAKFR